MGVRILHCGSALENYNLCVLDEVAGFTRRIASIGDLVYLAVRVGKKSYCGARGVLADIMDHRVWEDSDSYPQAFKMSDVEYCEPFEISELSKVGGKYWNLIYVQGAKTISDDAAIELLDELFSSRIQDRYTLFSENTDVVSSVTAGSDSEGFEDDIPAEQSEKLNIMGTFLTVKFRNEQDPVSGLETLVNDNFYELFDEFDERRTVLISDNRRFRTKGATNSKNEKIAGVSGIPDAVIIKFNKGIDKPFQINLIEYECYGESKTRSIDKFNYMNGHIIPQLMRFASTFSVVTDGKIREQTIGNWVDKIIEYVFDNEKVNEKVASWVRELRPGIKEQQISLELNRLLVEAFQSNIRIILVIDEMTSEQSHTLKNVINSFKLERDGAEVDFSSYVVRLQQRITTLNSSADYAISIQK